MIVATRLLPVVLPPTMTYHHDAVLTHHILSMPSVTAPGVVPASILLLVLQSYQLYQFQNLDFRFPIAPYLPSHNISSS